MAKAKTSRKRAFSFDDIPALKLKNRVGLREYDPTVTLRDRKFIVQALVEALLDGDEEAFKEILAGHLAVIHKESFYKNAGISRRTLFRMIASEGNPTLASIARVVRAIGKTAA